MNEIQPKLSFSAEEQIRPSLAKVIMSKRATYVLDMTEGIDWFEFEEEHLPELHEVEALAKAAREVRNALFPRLAETPAKPIDYQAKLVKTPNKPIDYQAKLVETEMFSCVHTEGDEVWATRDGGDEELCAIGMTASGVYYSVVLSPEDALRFGKQTVELAEGILAEG